VRNSPIRVHPPSRGWQTPSGATPGGCMVSSQKPLAQKSLERQWAPAGAPAGKDSQTSSWVQA
jgi:hypothetical protein